MPATTDWDVEVTKDTGPMATFETPPAGNHRATVVGLVDIGHHKVDKDDGTTYDQRQIVVVYELSKTDTKGNPFVMGQKFNRSMRDNSNFYAMVCNLTGTKYQEGQKFDPRCLVGKPCMVQVLHTAGKSKKGKDVTYANIGSVSQFPDDLPAPVPTYKPLVWSVGGGEPIPSEKWLPVIYGKTVDGLIRESVEFGKGGISAATETAEVEPIDDDAVPF